MDSDNNHNKVTCREATHANHWFQITTEGLKLSVDCVLIEKQENVCCVESNVLVNIIIIIKCGRL